MSNLHGLLGRVAFATVVVATTSGFLFPKRYPAPAEGTPTAILALQPVPTKDGRASSLEPVVFYNIYSDATCDRKAPGSGFIGTVSPPTQDLLSKAFRRGDASALEVPVVAGEPIHLRANGKLVLDSRRQSSKSLICINLIRFTPEQGRRYMVRQLSLGSRCVLGLVDEQTMLPPDDLQQVPLEGACNDH